MTVDEGFIVDSVPMTLKELQAHMQRHYDIPVVIRKAGTTFVECPYCLRRHDHGPQPGRHSAACAGTDLEGATITVGDKFYTPAFGYNIIEYKNNGGGIIELIE